MSQLADPFSESLISIKGLSVVFETDFGSVHALTDVNLSIAKNETIGIVGESGCGKTTLGLSLIGLLPVPFAKITSGSIEYRGKDIAKLDKKGIQMIRGTEIFMIFQEPMTSLNPVLTIEDQLWEAVKVRLSREKSKADLSRKKIHSELLASLKSVKISDPERVLSGYPHQLSGGMRQRLMISMALLLKPSLIIADEPTTALDVTTQDQIMKLLKELVQSKLETSLLFITHDLNLIRTFAQRIVVMYSGEIVEEGSSHEIIRNPKHPYTQGLVECLPRIHKSQGKLETIRGTVPDLTTLSASCKFISRCKYAFEKCQSVPPLTSIENGKRSVRCFLYE